MAVAIVLIVVGTVIGLAGFRFLAALYFVFRTAIDPEFNDKSLL